MLETNHNTAMIEYASTPKIPKIMQFLPTMLLSVSLRPRYNPPNTMPITGMMRDIRYRNP